MTRDHDVSSITRRQVLAGAGGTGLLAAAAPISARAATRTAAATAADGTPEQIHLTWGDDPASSVTVSWASPGPARRPRVVFRHAGGGSRVVPAAQRIYTDGINGETVWTYHAELTGLRPSQRVRVHGHRGQRQQRRARSRPRSAPRRAAGRRSGSPASATWPRRTPQWVLSYGQSAYAVAAVESFRPLFHLLNGDLCYANLNPATQPEVWRDFGNNNQASAAHRAWMPCLGNHEVEFDNGPQGFTSYLTRYSLPDNGVPGFRGRWYSFRVGSVLFVSLDADDVVYQDAAAFVAGPARSPRRRAPGTRPSRRAPRSTSAATPAARRRPGWSARWPRRAGTRPSTGSSSRCTRSPARPRPRATAPTSGSGRPGCRCSTGTRSTWC